MGKLTTAELRLRARMAGRPNAGGISAERQRRSELARLALTVLVARRHAVEARSRAEAAEMALAELASDDELNELADVMAGGGE